VWPLRSSRQRYVRHWNDLVDRDRRILECLDRICSATAAVAWLCPRKHLGVVKPHGRLGPLRLESIAGRPRAAYRRSRLLRPFRRVIPSGVFILGRASHLDAFSGYHSRPSLPGVALGRTTGTRAGRPTRSSRTRVRSPQHSNAHDGYRPNCLTTF
jgi:hypothetical protein